MEIILVLIIHTPVSGNMSSWEINLRSGFAVLTCPVFLYASRFKFKCENCYNPACLRAPQFTVMIIVYIYSSLKADPSKDKVVVGVIFQQPLLQYPLCKHDLHSTHICTEAGMQTVILTLSVVCLHVLNTLPWSWHTRKQSAGALATRN